MMSSKAQPQISGAPLPNPPTAVLQDDFSPGKGNALQAAVASIFGLPLHDVPNLIESPLGYEDAIAQFYNQQQQCKGCTGYVVKIKFKSSYDNKNDDTNNNGWSYKAAEMKYLCSPGDQNEHLDEMEVPCNIPTTFNEKICILRGKSPRGDFGHVVVAKHLDGGKFELTHDPHPDATFLDMAEAFGWCLFFG